ncbi:GNAT family N-acetyltransferase [Streptomyces sp. NPDC047108]|uniref:GNAT family N-acetyltransferase n=1 Tax=Streptomyces sp. NPDC047108 TaxID=3155025 RepID=UPI0033BFEA9F
MCVGFGGAALESFAPDHFRAAAELLAARHRRDLASEPSLSPSFGDPDTCGSLLVQAWEEGARGAVALEGNTVVGYLLARSGDGLRGRHCWTQPQDAACSLGAGPVIMQQLYAHLSGQWLVDGCLHHYTVTPASDLSLWLMLGFAHEQVHAIMALSGTARPTVPPPGVRSARPEDIDALEPLLGLVNAAHAAPPVFAFTDQPMWDILRSGHLELLGDPTVAYWVSENPDGIDGFTVMRPVPDDEASLMKPRGSVELLLAASAPQARGRGVGRRLAEHAWADAVSRGFRTCVTDWRAANPLSSVFWPRRGFRPHAYRLHRILDPRLLTPEHVPGLPPESGTSGRR